MGSFVFTSSKAKNAQAAEAAQALNPPELKGLNNGMAEPFGFMGHTSLKIVERETTEFNTAEVSQPIPNTAAPTHQTRRWKNFVNW